MSTTDGMETDSTDYTSFDYQYIETKVNHRSSNNNTDNPRIPVQFEFDPIDEQGGLANNEVAELVAIHLDASFEDEGSDSSPNITEWRGVIGANLPNSPSGYLSDPNSKVRNSGELGSGRVTPSNIDDLQDEVSSSNEKVRNEFFETFVVRGGDGSASSAPYEPVVHKKTNFRDMYGRGPVLDNTDTMSINTLLTSENNDGQTFGDLRLRFVWDLAEMSDAGRQFSVPTDD